MTERDPASLLLLSRADCPLCEEMEVELRVHASSGPLALQLADVDANPVWQRRYGLRVPVLLDAWSEVVCEGRFDAESFEQWQRESARRA